MENIKEILSSIPPASLDYQEWINVGMALKHEGFPCELWDDWSNNDRRYKKGDCQKKWQTFGGNNAPVTGGTLLQYALDRGYRPVGHELGWNDAIGRHDDALTVIPNDGWLETKEVPTPTDTDAITQVIRYFELLFEPGENVGYVMESYKDEKREKWIPKNKGSYTRTVGELLEKLKKCNGDIGAVLGDYNPQAGAWVRFNPVDGKGVKNENITEYRYALVESDTLSLTQQYTLLTELQIPVAVMVHSGGKSLHAIVRIDALSYDDYRKKVDFLYSVCQKNGLDIDKQNKNPSRLSRLPGIMRGEQRQYIVAQNIGLSSFEEWKEYIESMSDDLPEVDTLASVMDNLPALADELIEGILREGHKMLIAGPSKAGKSYALIQLVIAIAEGTKWLNKQCKQGSVLYVNLELDKASCFHRFKDVYEALNIPQANVGKIDIWNLRGKSVPMDKLAPKLIRRALKKRYVAVVLDPIYKVITGDENSADQMANFCNQFDKICTELGCAVIYCHHHSKGNQGQKKSADRASGSGVFARDPDALLDMIELDLPESTKTNMAQLKKREAILPFLDDDAEDKLGQDAMCSFVALQSYANQTLSADRYQSLLQTLQAVEQTERQKTAWRLESTLREFAPIDPVKCFFEHPIHKVDTSGILQDLTAEGEKKSMQAVTKARKENAQQAKSEREKEFRNAVQNANMGEPPTIKEVAEYLDVSEKTVRRRVNEFGLSLDKNDGKIHGTNGNILCP